MESRAASQELCGLDPAGATCFYGTLMSSDSPPPDSPGSRRYANDVLGLLFVAYV